MMSCNIRNYTNFLSRITIFGPLFGENQKEKIHNNDQHYIFWKFYKSILKWHVHILYGLKLDMAFIQFKQNE